jgi:hypothetical protein
LVLSLAYRVQYYSYYYPESFSSEQNYLPLQNINTVSLFKAKMKTILFIPLLIVILFSGINVTLSSHYCGGSLVANKVSVSGGIATCGMEQTNSKAIDYVSFGRKCCEDHILILMLSNSCFPDYLQLIKPLHGKKVIYFQSTLLSECQLFNSSSPANLFPPGENFTSRLNQPYLSVLRI